MQQAAVVPASTRALLAVAALLALTPHRAAAVRSLRRSVEATAAGADGGGYVALPPAPAAHRSHDPAAYREGLLHPFSQTHQRHYELVPIGAAVVLYGVTCCVVLATSALMVCCMYDAAAQWCHRSHFHACRSKVQRVHEVFYKKKGEPVVCPYCVEYVSSSSRMRQPVVFLCGHRFHVECANRWFREHPGRSGRCPLCDESGQRRPPEPAEPAPPDPEPEPPAQRSPLAACAGRCCGREAGVPPPTESSNDEALSFILGSLHREYPQIVTEDCVKRWASCRTEIWLSELRCPKYNSLLQKQPK